MKSKKGKLGLEEVIKSAREKIESNQKLIYEEKEKHNYKIIEFWKNENNLYVQKKSLYKGILTWHDEFILSPEHIEIFDLLKSSYRSFLIIFGSNWGHKMDGDSYGCWSRVILEREGYLKYQSGYKWMGISDSIELKENPIIAKKFTCQYLQRFHDCLYSDEIYERIKKEIESVSGLR